MKMTIVVSVLAMVCLMAGCRIEAIHNIRNTPVPQSEKHSLTLGEVRAAIMRSQGDPRVLYTMQDVKPGLIKCELSFKNVHKAWMDIPYSTTGYSILYEKSQELRYQPAVPPDPISGIGAQPETIKAHYNNWIRALNAGIQKELWELSSSTNADVEAKGRLLKLNKLREAGLISQEEFDNRRDRILDEL